MYGRNLSDAGLLDLSENGLDRLLVRPIAAHDTVRGWIFFDMDEPFLFGTGDTITYRWKAEDSTGEKYDIFTDSIVSPPVKVPQNDITLPEAVLRFSKAHIDLRSAGITFQRWVGGFIPVPNK